MFYFFKYLRNCLLVCWLSFGCSSVQHLEEIRSFCTHPTVNVRLGTLNVIVQIVSEHMDQIDRVISSAFGGVSGKQYESDVTHIVIYASVGVLKFQRRFSMAEKHRGSRVRCSKALFELLHEHLADNHVVFVAKSRRKHDGDSVCFRFDIPENSLRENQ